MRGDVFDWVEVVVLVGVQSLGLRTALGRISPE